MNILNNFKKASNFRELGFKQMMSVIAFYNNTISGKCSDITFSEFFKHNVFIDNNGNAVIGYKGNTDKFFEKWRKDPDVALHLKGFFYGMTENEEMEIIFSMRGGIEKFCNDNAMEYAQHILESIC